MHLEVHISIVSIRVLRHVFVLKSVSLYNKDLLLNKYSNPYILAFFYRQNYLVKRPLVVLFWV